MVEIKSKEEKIRSLNVIKEQLRSKNREIMLDLKRRRFNKQKIIEQTVRIRDTCNSLIEPINSIGSTINVIKSKQNEIGLINDEIQTLGNERINTLEERSKQHKSQISALAKGINQATGNFNEEIESLYDERQKMLKAIQELELKCEENDKVIEMKENNIQNINDDTKKIALETEAIQKEAQQRNATITSLRKEMEESKTNFENEIGQSNFELDEETEKLRLLNDALLTTEKSLNDHRNYNESMKKICDKSEKDIEILMQSIANNRNALLLEEQQFAKRKDTIAEELECLKARKKQMRNSLLSKTMLSKKETKNITKEIDEIVASNDRLSLEINELQNNLAIVDSKLANRLLYKNKLKSDIEDIEKEISMVNIERDIWAKKMIEERNDLTNAMNQIESSIGENKEKYETKINNLENEMKTLKDDTSEIIAMLNSEYSKKKIELENETNAINIEFNKIMESCKNTHTKFRATRASNENLKKQIADLEKEYKSSRCNDKDNKRKPDSSITKRKMDTDEASVSSTEGIPLLKLNEIKNRLRKIKKRP